MTIGERLQTLIESQGLTIADVARAADLDRQAVWRIVRGEVANPGILTVEKIAEAVGGTIADLYPELFTR